MILVLISIKVNSVFIKFYQKYIFGRNDQNIFHNFCIIIRHDTIKKLFINHILKKFLTEMKYYYSQS